MTNWYAVTDSDWDWDTDPFVCLAKDEAQAAKFAIAHWEANGETGDGAHLKVARLQLTGFVNWDKVNGFDPFDPLKSSDSIEDLRTELAASQASEARMREALEQIAEDCRSGQFEQDALGMAEAALSDAAPNPVLAVLQAAREYIDAEEEATLGHGDPANAHRRSIAAARARDKSQALYEAVNALDNPERNEG